MKEFNITGTCIPSEHYMVDTSLKLDKIIKLIEKRKYFIINRPRQFGKTTTMYLLDRRLKENREYLLIKLSFEGMGEEFASESRFVKSFIELIVKKMKFLNKNKIVDFIENYKEVEKIKQLDDFITDLVLEIDKKVILMIDEVDKSSNNQLFLNFIGILRTKYLMRNEGEDYTFHSVILAGVHDVKNMKLKLRPDEQRQYNSPWNIAVDFDIDMSFSADEIKTMLIDYTNETKVEMDIDFMAKKLREFTSGYPFLVSALCKIIDEKLNRDFSEKGLEEAIKIMLNENNTLFDDLIKNINRYDELYNLAERIVLDGEEIHYNLDAHNLGVMYGIFRESRNHKLIIHNKIFEIRLYNYMIAMREIKKGAALNYKYMGKFIDENGDLDMELVLIKFQELMKAEYRKIDEKFVEREGRLLFLAFLKPIINGTGFYFVESETRHSNRMDIVVTYNNKKFVIELKIWRGGQYEQEGREQLCGYLEAQNLNKGYMIFYNFNKNKEYIKDRLNVAGKEIFEIGV
ncbi:AAA family ATPase [Haliovirga abyssi]|uniref:AAA-ATPase-like domain-containing protein n=1 Tax=Haliovirga abyssi TaxID=2996794 RepID=A0AAU9E3X6_9FUSO|nr:AAA family ATPase [Haliovirga abyssi]BDU51180.1 hypothetical protein HLVA_17490 [Haliovirga abyssi]